MAFLGILFFCLLLNNVFSFPPQGLLSNNGLGLNRPFGPNFGSLVNERVGKQPCGNVNAQSGVFTGTVAQTVSPGYNPNWQANAQLSPVVTEIVPTLQFGDINLDGELPVGGTIKISGTFPVYGYIGVDGAVPSYGTAYVDTGNGLVEFCNCS